MKNIVHECKKELKEESLKKIKDRIKEELELLEIYSLRVKECEKTLSYLHEKYNKLEESYG